MAALTLAAPPCLTNASLQLSRVRVTLTGPLALRTQTTGAADVTKVRIMGDSRENERRINEEVNRQGRRQKLLYEAESSARQNAAVAMKWSALFDKEIPQELLAEVPLADAPRAPAAASQPARRRPTPLVPSHLARRAPTTRHRARADPHDRSSIGGAPR